MGNKQVCVCNNVQKIVRKKQYHSYKIMQNNKMIEIIKFYLLLIENSAIINRVNM